MIRRERFVGRVFSVRDPGPGALSVLRTLAVQTSQARVGIEQDGLVGVEANRYSLHHADQPAWDRPAVWCDSEGYWRIGAVWSAEDNMAMPASIEGLDLELYVRCSMGSDETRWHGVVEHYCAALPPQLADHPMLLPLARWSIWTRR